MNLEKKTTTFEAENNWAHFRICFRSFGHFTFFLAKHQYLFQNVLFKLQIFMTLIWLHSSSFLRIRHIHRSLRSLTSMKKGESWTLKFSSKFSFSTFCHLAFLWVSISGLFLTTNSFNYFCSKKEGNIGNKQKKSSYIRVHFTVHLTAPGWSTLWSRVDGGKTFFFLEFWWFTKIRSHKSQVLCCTLCVPCRLSDTLLAKILNLSTHASRSSFTPTTVCQDQY